MGIEGKSFRVKKLNANENRGLTTKGKLNRVRAVSTLKEGAGLGCMSCG